MLSRIVKTKRGRVVTLAVAVVLSLGVVYVGSYLMCTTEYGWTFYTPYGSNNIKPPQSTRYIDNEWQRAIWSPLIWIETRVRHIEVVVDSSGFKRAIHEVELIP